MKKGLTLIEGVIVIAGIFVMCVIIAEAVKYFEIKKQMYLSTLNVCQLAQYKIDNSVTVYEQISDEIAMQNLILEKKCN